jgi:pimeloyl-ACP methyl ester carboxylesterase
MSRAPWWIRVFVATAVDLLLLPAALVLLCVEWWEQRRRAQPVRGAGPPQSHSTNKVGVMLLHGSGFNKSEWCVGRYLLQRWLPKHYHVFAMNYAGLVSNRHEDGVDTYAGIVYAHLDGLHAEYGIRRWILVGHSMGGLVASYVAEHLSDGSLIIDQVLTVSTPWQGAPALEWLAKKSSAPLPVRQQHMRRGNGLLVQLTDKASEAKRRYVSFGSDVDLMVPHARWMLNDKTAAYRYGWLGHYAIVAWPPLWRQIVAELLPLP